VHHESPPLKSLFRRKEEIVARDIADEHILVPIQGDLANMQQIFALNPVAEFVWKELDGTRSAEQIAKQVTEEFDVEADQAEQDVREFLGELLAARLIEKLPQA